MKNNQGQWAKNAEDYQIIWPGCINKHINLNLYLNAYIHVSVAIVLEIIVLK